jgi:F0F1-type ATP synthase assembly protein I
MSENRALSRALKGRAIAMGTKQTIGFGGGMIIGILVGAVIDNMAVGIILGGLLGFGILQIPDKHS